MNEGPGVRPEPRQDQSPEDRISGLLGQAERLNNVPATSINAVRSRVEAFATAPSEQRLKEVQAHIRELQKLANAPVEWGPIETYGKSFGQNVYMYKREGDTLLAWAPGSGAYRSLGMQKLDPVTGRWATLGMIPDDIEGTYARVMDHLNKDAQARSIFEQNTLLERFTTYGNISYKVFREQTKQMNWSDGNARALSDFDVMHQFQPAVATEQRSPVRLDKPKGDGTSGTLTVRKQSVRRKEERERMEQREQAEREAELQRIEARFAAESRDRDGQAIEQINEVDRKRYATAIAWYLSTLYETPVPSDPDVLGVRYVDTPHPTSHKFHNSFSNHFEITHPRFKEMLGSNFMSYGLNHFEIEQIRHEVELHEQHPDNDQPYRGKLLIPRTERHGFGNAHVRILKRVEKHYGRDIDPKDVVYVQEFRAYETRKSVLGFAIIQDGKFLFLFGWPY